VDVTLIHVRRASIHRRIASSPATDEPVKEEHDTNSNMEITTYE
jgi:hypothetical protein